MKHYSLSCRQFARRNDAEGGEIMKSREASFFPTVVILFSLSSFSFGYHQVIDLGTLGGDDSEAYSINDRGQIAGKAWVSSDCVRPCLFDSTGGGDNLDLGTLGSSGYWSLAFSVNNNGQIVGQAEDSSGSIRACLFDSTGGGANTDLALGGNYSVAFSINDSGQIVGQAKNPSGSTRAYLFDSTGGGANTDLGTIGGNSSAASSINNSGQIVGSAANSSGYYRACLFDSTGDANNNINLGTLNGYEHSQAYSINEKGQIAGWAYDGYGNGRACLFDPNGSGNNKDLGTLGGDWSEARSINDSNQIAGWANDSSGGARACIFDPLGGSSNIDLNTLIDPCSGWTLFYATGINNNGWVTGCGVNPDGYWHGYLLVPEDDMVLVNMEAFARFAAQWLSADCATADYCKCADFDFDGNVDIEDLGWLAAHWLCDIPSTCD